MASIETIQRSFASFVEEISKNNGKKLSKREIINYLREIEIFARLLEEKAFIKPAEKLEWIYKSLKNKESIDSSVIKRLKEILVSLDK
ncbi:hypothetical protein HYV89_02920 [Candidatus Woesearchaeota archaeon]|nr:hypothetical protein [Candidatus Woesearchaeota archaeon]